MITSDNLPIIQKLLADAIYIKNNTVVTKVKGKIDQVKFEGEIICFDDTPFIIYKSPFTIEFIDFSESSWRVVVEYDYGPYLTILLLDDVANEICIDQDISIPLTDDYKINIDGLDKSVLDWTEEDLLYYTLKNS